MSTIYVCIMDVEDGLAGLEIWNHDGPPLLACGCIAMATTEIPGWSEGEKITIHCCPVHDGIKSKSILGDGLIHTLHRRAKCDYCKALRESSPKLAFFRLQNDKEFDSFYCGCRGWD